MTAVMKPLASACFFGRRVVGEDCLAGQHMAADHARFASVAGAPQQTRGRLGAHERPVQKN